MAFLPRAGRHAAGPVWPLPAVPAAWHRAEPLIKQPCLLGAHLGTHGAWPRPTKGLLGGLAEGAVPLQAVERGTQTGRNLPRHPRLGEPLGCPLPAPTEGLGFPIWDQDVAQSRTWWLAGPAGPRPGPVVWQEAPVPRETVSKSQVAAAEERRGPATPTGPGMRKEPRECAAPLPRLCSLLGPGSTPAPASGLRAHPPRGPALTTGQPQAPPPGPTFQKHFLGQARAQHTGSSPPEGPPWRLAGPWARRGLLPLFLLGRPVARPAFRSALRGRRTTTAGARLAGSAGSFGGAGVSAWGSGTVSATCSLTQSSTCSCACLALLEARPQAGPRGQGCPALTSEVPALHPTVFPKAAHSGGAAAD